MSRTRHRARTAPGTRPLARVAQIACLLLSGGLAGCGAEERPPSGPEGGADGEVVAPADAGGVCLPIPGDLSLIAGDLCVRGRVGGGCGDVAELPVCVGGAWGCPAGLIPARQCACVGPGPCGPDAGAGARDGG